MDRISNPKTVNHSYLLLAVGGTLFPSLVGTMLIPYQDGPISRYIFYVHKHILPLVDRKWLV